MAVINPNISVNTQYSKIDDKDFRVEWFSGTGSGGQHRNKRKNCCRLIHLPTGLSETKQGKHRASNYKQAKSSLIERLRNNEQSDIMSKISNERKKQVGSGMRGDKIRTYRFKDNLVFDHVLNSQARCDKVMKGYFELLWK